MANLHKLREPIIGADGEPRVDRLQHFKPGQLLDVLAVVDMLEEDSIAETDDMRVAVVEMLADKEPDSAGEAVAYLHIGLQALGVLADNSPSADSETAVEISQAHRLIGLALPIVEENLPAGPPVLFVEHARETSPPHIRRQRARGAAAGAPAPDPLVELERRYGEIAAPGRKLDMDALDGVLDEIVDTPVSSIAGLAVMARLLINNTKEGTSIWDEGAAAAILEWIGRQTGRNEFIGAMNQMNVGVEPAEAEAAA
ncbi:MAG TPA: hypothetical protein PKA13_21585 [Geminicoccaceae bacterium]|mgnify:CR=1 FL=1|nr:hypothetical protein [Geminicoccus sp.]HMU52387.1 hypothetical protein [Geminicoccaceae bacterium]